ncbi:MAG: M48 family metallopeptidase [Verrucomicrobia bacterium]|nr:M48 family metallopeptidase [Verrucomicrobiota bacterium]MCF7707744.1 M48 family metallopeptidase [Verrucomicrobiota bacterium]
MDFFEHQEVARSRTKWLTFFFFLAVTIIIAAVYLVVQAAFFFNAGNLENGFRWWDPEQFLWVVVCTLVVVGLGSFFKLVQLRQGGKIIATGLGGHKIDPSTSDPDERKLLNVVEEMSIASGVPVPDVFLLKNEKGINAFAAGNSTSDAVIGVTRGCMELLNRDELQGVIAHEFSHILNGDMRLNLRLMGILHGILCIALIGRVLLYMSVGHSHRTLGARDRRGANPLPLLGLLLIIIGSIGVFFGKLIKSAISRQREFLADASAVQFTRNGLGLSGALKKIGGLTHGSRLKSPMAEEASHLFFGNGLRSNWFSLMSTHPSLVTRIRKLDPMFNGEFPRVSFPEKKPIFDKERGGRAARSRTFERIPIIGAMNFPDAVTDVKADRITNLVGGPGIDQLAFAAALTASLPEKVEVSTREAFGACALVYTILISNDEKTRDRQMRMLAETIEPPMLKEVERLQKEISGFDAKYRLPVIELCIPALRQMSPEQYKNFSGVTRAIIESDRQIDVFEYALQRLLTRHLDSHFIKSRRPVIQYYSIKAVMDECRILLSGLAWVGNNDDAKAEQAYNIGFSRLGEKPGLHGLLEHEACNLPQIDRALEKISHLSPPLRKKVLDACAYTVAADEKIKQLESEMLRAIADSLDCPIPPLLHSEVPE